MTIKKMTLEEIERSITPQMRRRMRHAMLREPDMTDPDAPEMTDVMFVVARRPGRSNPAMKKVSQNIRFDQDVLAGLKSTGRNWSTRVNAIMRGYLSGLGVL
ncbi:MAG: BrnA antitoxin family protein [Rickettsiales bacterium]|jgi:uncharacterized protein (DUF4415 family)|nr:BrnA antitoxin family protein [Rickettsiales bacterium]